MNHLEQTIERLVMILDIMIQRDHTILKKMNIQRITRMTRDEMNMDVLDHTENQDLMDDQDHMENRGLMDSQDQAGNQDRDRTENQGHMDNQDQADNQDHTAVHMDLVRMVISQGHTVLEHGQQTVHIVHLVSPVMMLTVMVDQEWDLLIVVLIKIVDHMVAVTTYLMLLVVPMVQKMAAKDVYLNVLLKRETG